LADLRARAHPGARLKAQPGRGRLLRRPAQVVSPNDFHDLAQIEARLSAFEIRYNATASPFDWKFTADDLNDLLARIGAHERSDDARAA
jgi:hypothetical protein